MRRTQKLVITTVIVAAAGGLILWNTAAEGAAPALGVTEAKRRAADLDSTEVAVRGTVIAESILVNGSRVEEFVIADALEQLRVRYGQAPPDNFGPKDVVVYGTLSRMPDGTVLLDASSIQVGCSSKY